MPQMTSQKDTSYGRKCVFSKIDRPIMSTGDSKTGTIFSILSGAQKVFQKSKCHFFKRKMIQYREN